MFSGLGCFLMDSWLKNQEIPCMKDFVCFYIRFHVFQYIYSISLNEWSHSIITIRRKFIVFIHSPPGGCTAISPGQKCLNFVKEVH